MRAIVLFGFIVCVGCASPPVDVPEEVPPGDRAFQLMTDDSTYLAEVTNEMASFEATLTFINVGGEPAYFTGCRPPEQPFLEKRVLDGWVRAFEPVFLMCLSAPVGVEPGERLDYSYVASAGFPGSDVHPHWLVEEIEGEYRLRWDLVEGGVLQNDFEIEGGLPATVYSNTFTVRVADPD